MRFVCADSNMELSVVMRENVMLEKGAVFTDVAGITSKVVRIEDDICYIRPLMEATKFEGNENPMKFINFHTELEMSLHLEPNTLIEIGEKFTDLSGMTYTVKRIINDKYYISPILNLNSFRDVKVFDLNSNLPIEINSSEALKDLINVQPLETFKDGIFSYKVNHISIQDGARCVYVEVLPAIPVAKEVDKTIELVTTSIKQESKGRAETLREEIESTQKKLERLKVELEQAEIFENFDANGLWKVKSNTFRDKFFEGNILDIARHLRETVFHMDDSLIEFEKVDFVKVGKDNTYIDEKSIKIIVGYDKEKNTFVSGNDKMIEVLEEYNTDGAFRFVDYGKPIIKVSWGKKNVKDEKRKDELSLVAQEKLNPKKDNNDSSDVDF